MSLKVTQAECIKTERLELKSKEHMLSLIENLIAFSQTEDTAHLEYGIF